MAENGDIGKYQILKKLNDRNSVFVVRNTDDNSLWVQKFIENESVPIYKKMLHINHPNIAYINEVYEIDNGAIVIEEFVEGISLFEAIEKGVNFTLYDVRRIMGQLCEGIKCIHSYNIIHRDISANNVIIDSKGNGKLIDLGISRIKDSSKSADTYLMGTAGYAAPEQFGFRQTDERADIFALGVLINVMLTGDFPSKGIYSKNQNVKKIITKCIEMEPHNRYKNISDLKKAILNIPTEKDKVFVKFFKEMPGFRTRRWWKMLLASVYYMYVLLYIGVTIYFMFVDRITDALLLAGWIFTGIWCPYLLAGNYKYYIDRMKITAQLPKFIKTIICLALGFILAVISFEILCSIVI